MHTIRKLYKFEMAHQLADATTAACYETIHGHSYRVELFLGAIQLNDANMVRDFGSLDGFTTWLMAKFDHALLIPDAFNRVYKDVLEKYNKKIWFTPENPTAEWMAKVIFEEACRLLDDSEALVTRVRVHETDTGYAEYES